MVSRRYWPGVVLTVPVGVLLGFWAGGAFDTSNTGWGSPGAFVVPGMMLGGGTALGAAVGGIIATRRVDTPVGSSDHVLAVAWRPASEPWGSGSSSPSPRSSWAGCSSCTCS